MAKAKIKTYVEPKAVQRAVDRKAPETLRAAGAYVRRVAQNSIKTRKNKNKASQPGTPPHNHTFIKKSIVFGVVPDRKVVLIGPMHLRGGHKNVARIQEFGGNAVMNVVDPDKWNGMKIGDEGPVTIKHFSKRKDLVKRRDPHKDPATGRMVIWITLRTQTQADHSTRLYRRLSNKYPVKKLVGFPARPYMGPALVRSTPKLGKFWQNSVRP